MRLDEPRRDHHAAVRDRLVHRRHLHRGHADALADRDGADRRRRPAATWEDDARRLAREVEPGPPPEPVPADPVHEEWLSDDLRDGVGADVRRLLEDLRRVVGDRPAPDVVVDELVADADLPRQVPEHHVRVDQPRRERGRERDDLVGRARLVCRHQRVVLRRARRREVGQRVDLVVVVAGRRGHRQDRPRAGIEHDPGGPLRARRLDRLAQDRLDLAWTAVSSVSVTSRPGTARWSLRVSSVWPIGSCTTTCRPGFPMSTSLYCCSIPATPAPPRLAGAVDLRVPDDLRREPVERVPAGQLGDGRDAGQVVGHDASGDLGLGAGAGSRPRRPAAGPRSPAPAPAMRGSAGTSASCGAWGEALFQLVIAESAGDDRRRVVRMLQPILVDHDRLRRLLLGQVLVVGAQDRPSQPWQGHDCALLRDGLSRKRGRVDDLDLRRPEHDDGEGRQRERQHEPQPAVRHLPHGAGRPPDDEASRTGRASSWSRREHHPVFARPAADRVRVRQVDRLVSEEPVLLLQLLDVTAHLAHVDGPAQGGDVERHDPEHQRGEHTDPGQPARGDAAPPRP